MWYYSGQGREMDGEWGHEVSICKAFRWATWYHCGSIAFGSFLIAVVQMIRIVFEYIIYQYEKVGDKENPVYKAFKCVARCILWCLDQCVKFITKNAYI
jgi:choline transporter-like protein 2/4/5